VKGDHLTDRAALCSGNYGNVVATGVVNILMPPLCSAFWTIFRFPLIPTQTGTNNVRLQCSYLFLS